MERIISKSEPFKLGFCACGCGEEISIKTKTNPYLIRYKQYHHKNHRTGETHQNWKGGMKKHGKYMLILKRDHPNTNKEGYVFRHVLLMSEKIGRPIKKGEEVHHIDNSLDENGMLNDNIDNLMLFESHREHVSYEMKGNNRNPKIDMDNRRCSNPNCSKPNQTYKRTDTGRPIWINDKNGGYFCKNCWTNIGNKRRRKEKKGL